MCYSFRFVPTFGRDTIRRFSNNVSGMKKLAARDFEDILQVCTISDLALLVSQTSYLDSSALSPSLKAYCLRPTMRWSWTFSTDSQNGMLWPNYACTQTLHSICSIRQQKCLDPSCGNFRRTRAVRMKLMRRHGRKQLADGARPHERKPLLSIQMVLQQHPSLPQLGPPGMLLPPGSPPPSQVQALRLPTYVLLHRILSWVLPLRPFQRSVQDRILRPERRPIKGRRRRVSTSTRSKGTSSDIMLTQSANLELLIHIQHNRYVQYHTSINLYTVWLRYPAG